MLHFSIQYIGTLPSYHLRYRNNLNRFHTYLEQKDTLVNITCRKQHNAGQEIIKQLSRRIKVGDTRFQTEVSQGQTQ